MLGRLVVGLLASLLLMACGSDDSSSGDSGSDDATAGDDDSDDGGETPLVDPDSGLGETFTGEYHLGPVDWEESVWTNGCSPYDPAVMEAEGEILAGVETGHIDGGRLCDACVLITADNGNQINARLVTYGATDPNDIDLSPAACRALSGSADCDVWPRDMTWQFARCPDTGRIAYQFQTEANEWWTSFWVRNARLPIATVEVECANHGFTDLRRASDGTLNDDSGFGAGDFTIRVTAINGQTVTDTFSGFNPGELLESSGQFE